MKYLKYILFLLLIAIIGLAIYIAVQPNSFVVTTKTIIKAPAGVIFETIADTSTVDRSAYWKESEQLKNTSKNSPTSIVQTYSSKNIGNSELAWQLTPVGDGTTTVSKTITANNLSFMYKAKSVFSDRHEDELKANSTKDLDLLEKEVLTSMAEYSITDGEITEYGGGFYMYKTTSSAASNITNMMARQFADVMNFMQDNNIQEAGMPFTIYLTKNDNGNVIMSNAIPVRDKVVVADDSNVLCGYIEKTRSVKATLKGDYKNLDEAWSKLNTYMKDNNLEPSEQYPFEIYLNDPGSIPNPANYLTEIYIPIKAAVMIPETE